MSQDLLRKLQAQKIFTSHSQVALTLGKLEARIMTLTVPQGEKWLLYSLEGRPQLGPECPFKIPRVWAEDNPSGLAWNIPPVLVELRPGTEPRHQKQYFIPHKAQIGIHKHLKGLIKYAILRLCLSPWNTPLLPAQKTRD